MRLLRITIAGGLTFSHRAAAGDHFDVDDVKINDLIFTPCGAAERIAFILAVALRRGGRWWQRAARRRRNRSR